MAQVVELQVCRLQTQEVPRRDATKVGGPCESIDGQPQVAFNPFMCNFVNKTCNRKCFACLRIMAP